MLVIYFNKYLLTFSSIEAHLENAFFSSSFSPIDSIHFFAVLFEQTIMMIVIYGNESLRSAQFDIGCLDTYTIVFRFCFFFLFYTRIHFVIRLLMQVYYYRPFCHSDYDPSQCYYSLSPSRSFCIQQQWQLQTRALERFYHHHFLFVYRILLYWMLWVQQWPVCTVKSHSHQIKIILTLLLPTHSNSHDRYGMSKSTLRYMSRFHTWHHFLSLIFSSHLSLSLSLTSPVSHLLCSKKKKNKNAQP